MANFIERDINRRLTYLKNLKDRENLKKELKNRTLPMPERYRIQIKLNKLAANTSRIRLSNRCTKSGRTHSILRKFKLSRIELRNSINAGTINGFKKSSW